MDDLISRQAVYQELSLLLSDLDDDFNKVVSKCLQAIDNVPSVQQEHKFSRSDAFEILHKIKAECWNCGMNMTGEYQSAWTRFRDIEKTIDKYMQKMEEGE